MTDAHCSALIAPVPLSVNRSIKTSSARSRNGLKPTSCRKHSRSARVVILIGSTDLMRNGSIIVVNGTVLPSVTRGQGGPRRVDVEANLDRNFLVSRKQDRGWIEDRRLPNAVDDRENRIAIAGDSVGTQWLAPDAKECSQRNTLGSPCALWVCRHRERRTCRRWCPARAKGKYQKKVANPLASVGIRTAQFAAVGQHFGQHPSSNPRRINRRRLKSPPVRLQRLTSARPSDKAIELM